LAAENLPNPARALRLLGDTFHRLGRAEEGGEAHLRAVSAGIRDPELIEAGRALAAGELPEAEQRLRVRLKRASTDVAAIRMLAEVAGRLGRYADAERLLRRALELAPRFAPARANLAIALHRQNRPVEAIAEVDRLLDDDPANPVHRNLKAAALGRIGEYQEAVELYEGLIERFGDQHRLWMSYGHVLKTVGRHEDSVAAYRRAIALRPGLGEAWWSLANLKTVRFDDDDVAAMEAALAGRLDDEDRLQLEFALGKAYEDRRAFAESFRHYAEGNRIRRPLFPHDADEIDAFVDRCIAFFTPAMLSRRGCEDPDPIFIVGMPRAGSTLIEQILASHSQVEGTQELSEIPAIAARIGSGRALGRKSAYPACLGPMTEEELSALGCSYVEDTRVHRKTGRPFFIDKLPNNWLHAGLIAMILPNAKIIDARRHPLDCGFSNFKQHFARGQSFSYDLADMGRYYADYVRLMAHFDAAMPGRIHRVVHERIIEDTEPEIRALLDYLGLPFEDSCLRFWENDRAVHTPSAEQVRRPINREGMDRWRAYEPWLGPLKEALGPVLPAYPDAPDLA
jgi:tetratricopeptide (TPR) repeat protein